MTLLYNGELENLAFVLQIWKITSKCPENKYVTITCDCSLGSHLIIIEVGHQKDQTCDQRIRTAYESSLLRRREWDCRWSQTAQGRWFNQLCLRNESPVNTLGREAQLCFLLGEHVAVPAEWWALVPQGEIQKLHVPDPPHPFAVSSFCYSGLYHLW